MKKIVVLTGAGMSAESGISTFRDSNGLWEQYKVEDVATPEGYQRNQKLVIDFYNEMRRKIQDIKPNRGHELIASLEDDYEVFIITQNIDKLHEKAGSSCVLHLHGEIDKVTSSWEPNNPVYIKKLNPEDWEVKIGDLAADGSQLRPYIVWFGEDVPNILSAGDEVVTADIFLVIGTSMNVYPAAGLIEYVNRNCKIYVIDPKADELKFYTKNECHLINKGASEGMEEFIRLIKEN